MEIRAHLFSMLSSLWLGMLIALAIEARVKFNAPSLTREIGLDVGRHVFGVFGRVEIGALAALIALAIWSSPERWKWIAVAVVAAVILLQAIWLRPMLNERAALIIEGAAVPNSHAHAVYIGFELIKMLALLALALRLPASASP